MKDYKLGGKCCPPLAVEDWSRCLAYQAYTNYHPWNILLTNACLLSATYQKLSIIYLAMKEQYKIIE